MFHAFTTHNLMSIKVPLIILYKNLIDNAKCHLVTIAWKFCHTSRSAGLNRPYCSVSQWVVRGNDVGSTSLITAGKCNL